MSPALAWFNDASPMITAALGGGLAMISAVLLFMIATALGPDLPVMQCVSPRARFFMHLTALSWFVRGAMILTGMAGAEARHPHWDMPLSWSMTCGLLVYAFGYIWSQRMPPEVRKRFDRREHFRRERVQQLVAEGHPADAKMAAEGHDAEALAYHLGMSRASVEALRSREAPDRA